MIVIVIVIVIMEIEFDKMIGLNSNFTLIRCEHL